MLSLGPQGNAEALTLTLTLTLTPRPPLTAMETPLGPVADSFLDCCFQVSHLVLGSE